MQFFSLIGRLIQFIKYPAVLLIVLCVTTAISDTFTQGGKRCAQKLLANVNKTSTRLTTSAFHWEHIACPALVHIQVL